MDIQDPNDAKAVELYAADAAVSNLVEAASLLDASDVQVRDHYRGLARMATPSNPSPVSKAPDVSAGKAMASMDQDPVARAEPFLHADAHFRMGTGHDAEGTPCQDYATSGFMADGSPFAIVSDGCSSSGRTDVGARIAALSAARVLRSIEKSDDVYTATILMSLHAAFKDATRCLGLDETDLDATLCVVSALSNGGARAMVFGDGVVAARVPGGLDVRVVEWAGNMPGYPNYFMNRFRGDKSREEAFVSQSGDFAAAANRSCCTVSRHFVTENGEVTLTDEIGFSARTALEGILLEWGPEDMVDSVAVMSDGAMQVSGTEWSPVVLDLTSFKAARGGEFVRRRMGRALTTLAKRGSRPVDDIAVAAIAKGGTV